MTTSLWLRISSIASLLLAVGHTLGGRKAWSPVGDNDVLSAMRTVAFDVSGLQRTYLDFYLGFGYTLSVYLFLQAVLLWQLATIAKRGLSPVRAQIVVFFLATLAATLVAWRYLFTVPAAFSALVAACVGVALITTAGWPTGIAGQDGAVGERSAD